MNILARHVTFVSGYQFCKRFVRADRWLDFRRLSPTAGSECAPGEGHPGYPETVPKNRRRE